MKLGVYLDYYENTLLEQIELSSQLKCGGKIVLRNVCGKHFLDCNINVDILPYLNIKNIFAIDLGSHFLNTDNAEDNNIKTIKSILALVNINTIIFTIDFSKSIDLNVSYINKLLEIFPNYNFLLRYYSQIRGVIIDSIVNKVNKKRLTVLFDPASLYINELSFLTEYRILKNRLSGIILNDINEKERYTLIGYGGLKIIDFYKKLYEDRFQGTLFYDSQIEKTVAYFEPKIKIKNKLFKKVSYKIDYSFIKSKLQLDAKEKVKIVDILSNQLQVIQKIFNID